DPERAARGHRAGELEGRSCSRGIERGPGAPFGARGPGARSARTPRGGARGAELVSGYRKGAEPPSERAAPGRAARGERAGGAEGGAKLFAGCRKGAGPPAEGAAPGRAARGHRAGELEGRSPSKLGIVEEGRAFAGVAARVARRGAAVGGELGEQGRFELRV